MSDQAFRLRTLVSEGLRRGQEGAHASPSMLALVGGKGGVGTTTLAVNLAVALARDGRRTLLVDLDLRGPNVAEHCGLADGPCIADVLCGVRTLHEAMHRGPGGIQVLPGQWGLQPRQAWPSRALENLLHELQGLGPHADIVIIDAGANAEPVLRCVWRTVDEVALVTSPDSVAVMDAYAVAKSHCGEMNALRLATIVNQATTTAAAQDAHARLQRACRRFLGLDTRVLGTVPFDAIVREASGRGQPFVTGAAHGPAAQEIMQMISRLQVPTTPRRTAWAGYERGESLSVAASD